MTGCTARVLVCDVGNRPPADAATVDAVARLCLVARRHGWRVRLQGASPELRALLRLTGLGDVLLGLAGGAEPSSGLEARRQAEEREEPRGVEERVHRDDLPT